MSHVILRLCDDQTLNCHAEMEITHLFPKLGLVHKSDSELANLAPEIIPKCHKFLLGFAKQNLWNRNYKPIYEIEIRDENKNARLIHYLFDENGNDVSNNFV